MITAANYVTPEGTHRPSLVKLSYAMNTWMYNLKKMARMFVYLQYILEVLE